MKVKYINPLLESTLSVLSTMAMVEAKMGKPSVKQGSNTLGDITGMIDLSGADANGSLAISFSQAAILDITNKMLGEKITTIDDTVIDAVGEITNMITGNAKRIYAEQGIDFNLTQPSTTLGYDLPLNHSVTGDIILLPFTTDAGKFFLEFCFD
jgi:chemotaxis protein CheX